jgi:glycosyltransferase involved in cell wall biosynthesis
MQRPPKVLHVLNSAGGGAALSTVALIGALRKAGIESCAVCHDAGSPDERAQLSEAVGGELLFLPLYWWNRKIRSSLWKRPLLELAQGLRTGWARRSARAVQRFAVERCVDLVHTNTILTPEGGLAATRARLPHVWHIRELVGEGYPFPLALDGKRLGAFLEGHATRLVANSEATARLIRPVVRADILEVVPNGIDLGGFRPRAAPRSSDRVIVAMIGSLTSRWKKHALFIQAAANVTRELPVEYRVYGHDPCRGGRTGDAYACNLHALVQSIGLANRFSWSGFVPDPAQIMDEIDILVHPADHESFGRVAIEAMAAGIPVVGVAAGGIGEVVEHNITGLLAEPDSARQLARHIEQLARDESLRSRLGRAGRRRAEARYSLEAVTARIIAIYESALRRGPSGPVVNTQSLHAL